MTMEIYHSKVSTKADGSDPTKVLPSDWNQNHVLSGKLGVDDIEDNLQVSPNRKSAFSANSITTTIPNGGNGITTITPPVGYILKIVGLAIAMPSVVGATGGNHSVTIYANNLGAYYGYYATIMNTYNASLHINGFNAVTYSTMSPTTEASFILSLQGAEFSNSNPLCILYANNTNVSTAASAARIYNVQYVLIPDTDF
jgi:hypothetical protein